MFLHLLSIAQLTIKELHYDSHGDLASLAQ